MVGPSHARVVPLSLGWGAMLVVVADTVGRVIAPPTEVQVGIMTALVGIPVFFLLVRRGAEERS
jgi:iron complex transport system permease protein